MGGKNTAQEGILYPFQFENNVYYCPTEVYINYTGSDPNNIYRFYTLNFQSKKVEGDKKSGRKLSLEWYTGSTVSYDADSDKDGKFEGCKHGGDAEISEQEQKVSKLKVKIDNIYSDLDNAEGKEVIDISNDIEKLGNKISKLGQYCSFYNSETNLAADLDNLLPKFSEINEKMQNEKKLSNEQSDEIQDILDETSAKVSNLKFKLNDSKKQYSCEGLIADELEAVIQFVLKIIRIAAPILLIVLCTIDFSQAVISGDQDALKKTTSKVVKRAIAALALFLVPFFVSLAIDWVDDSEYFNKENANCTEVYK